MAVIALIVPERQPRRWQAEVATRLRAAGHAVGLVAMAGPRPWPADLDIVLEGERRLFGPGTPPLWAPVPLAAHEAPPGRPATLTLDLTGAVPAADLSLRFDGASSAGAALARLMAGGLPAITVVRRDGEVVARALPMADSRALTARALDDVLARAVTLAVAAAGRALRGGIGPMAAEAEVGDARAPSLVAYAGRALPRLGREAWRRARYRHAHWRVGYRLGATTGVAETGRLGSGWQELPDDGSRFFADPFVLAHEGTTALFVEDLPHATGKAVISVAPLEHGRFGAPVPVLEEPFHLSYPQVFRRDGAVWMIPESVGARGVLLYRAERFPDRWVRVATLIADRDLSDATLLEHGGRLWLFATSRDGHGSTSDTLVVYSADRLTGPWTPHLLNPVLIDRRAARPGGAFQRSGGRLLLPVQDGTHGYGSGLGFAPLTALDGETVHLEPPVPIDTSGDWPHPQIHTYNRDGAIEVIDGLVPMRR